MSSFVELHPEVVDFFRIVHGHYAVYTDARRLLELDTGTRYAEETRELTGALSKADEFILFLYRKVESAGHVAEHQLQALEEAARELYQRTIAIYEADLAFWQQKCQEKANQYRIDVLPHREKPDLEAKGAPNWLSVETDLETLCRPLSHENPADFDVINGDWWAFFEPHKESRTKYIEFVRQLSELHAIKDRIVREIDRLKLTRWGLWGTIAALVLTIFLWILDKADVLSLDMVSAVTGGTPVEAEQTVVEEKTTSSQERTD